MPDTEQQIDVRKLPPQKKHPTIFETFEQLDVGEAFVIINDHDPKPLGYQLAVTHGEEKFSWEYLKEGPDVWKVRIGKKAN
ncbi:MAG: DUF2249 domain-containing protein [Balneolaceae bacterium]|nr:DUF2249 domain-containing protein [Balneolaceae bacterium]